MRAATKLQSLQRGKSTRKAVRARRDAELGEDEEGDFEDDEYDLEEDGDDYEGAEGFGDFDMLEAAEVDADEEQVEEDKANLAELFKQAQEERRASSR